MDGKLPVSKRNFSASVLAKAGSMGQFVCGSEVSSMNLVANSCSRAYRIDNPRKSFQFPL